MVSKEEVLLPIHSDSSLTNEEVEGTVAYGCAETMLPRLDDKVSGYNGIEHQAVVNKNSLTYVLVGQMIQCKVESQQDCICCQFVGVRKVNWSGSRSLLRPELICIMTNLEALHHNRSERHQSVAIEACCLALFGHGYYRYPFKACRDLGV